MQKGRFYLLVLGLAGVLTMGPAAVHSQAGVDTAAVNARASAILADIEGRMSSAKSDDTKKCLRDKRAAVNAIKGRVAGAADLSSLMSELNAVGGELDACAAGADKTDKDKGGGTTGSGSAASGAGPAQVEMKVEEGTPGAEDSNPSVIIAPGPTASGPGVVDNGTTGGGPDTGGGGTGGGDTGTVTPIPVVPPPPISPMI
jgi:hypothetical protein